MCCLSKLFSQSLHDNVHYDKDSQNILQFIVLPTYNIYTFHVRVNKLLNIKNAYISMFFGIKATLKCRYMRNLKSKARVYTSVLKTSFIRVSSPPPPPNTSNRCREDRVIFLLIAPDKLPIVLLM